MTGRIEVDRRCTCDRVKGHGPLCPLRREQYDMDAAPLLRGLLQREDLSVGVKADIEVVLAEVERLGHANWCPHKDEAAAVQREYCSTCARSLEAQAWPPGQIQVIPAALTEEDVRRIIREELAKAFSSASPRKDNP